MSRYRRSYDGRTFFFTVVTHGRRKILCTKLGRECLRSAFRNTQESHPFETVAIVLLPDHIHAVWTLPEGDLDYSVRWRHIKARFTRSWIAEGAGAGEISASRESRGEYGIWQRRFFEHTVRDEKDLRRCVDYVHVNPLKHGLAERVADWPWSSFHRYVRLGEYSTGWGSAAEWYGDEFRDFE